MKELLIRNYHEGEEERIVDFLNFCYGRWGNINKWKYRYPSYPTFDKNNITVLEYEGKIIGHGGIHFRKMVFTNGAILVGLLGDGAIHPNFRGMRLHSRILHHRFEIASLEGAPLVLGWTLKGSGAHKSDIRAGFVEIKQLPAYIKIIKPEKVLKAGLKDFLAKNQKIRKILEETGVDISFRFEKYSFKIQSIIPATEISTLSEKDYIEIILNEKAMKYLVSFGSVDRVRKVLSLLYLLVSRKIKIKLGSLRAFLKLILKFWDFAKTI